jgi:hypothetical protein
MKHISKGFEFKIKIKGLDLEREYEVVLLSKSKSFVSNAELLVNEEDESITCVWSSEKTSSLIAAKLDLEIYSKDKTFYLCEPDFVCVHETSIVNNTTQS